MDDWGFFVSYPAAVVYEVVSHEAMPAGLIVARAIDPAPMAAAWARGAVVIDLREDSGAFFRSKYSAADAAKEMRRNLKAAMREAKRKAGQRPK